MTDTAPSYERLLDLQEHDTRLSQLDHKRITLPERAELTRTEREMADLEQLVAGVQSKRDAAARDQKRREDEVASIEAKVAELNSSMYGGGVTSPRELQTMQEEIDSLQRRLKGIEDDIIELMEYAEPLDAQLAESAQRRAVLDQQAQTTIGQITEQEVVIDGELATVRAERDSIAAGVSADMMEMYEDLRRSFAGVGIVRMEHGVCGGCHLALARAEVDRIKHLAPDVPVHCEECGRLLVR